MAGILMVHGIGQELEGPSTLQARLFPALRDGILGAGADMDPAGVSFASYGGLFREESEFLAPAPRYDPCDVQPGYEEDLLLALWERAASCDEAVFPPGEEALSRTPSVARRALAGLSRSRFLAGIAESAFIGDLKQVSRYFGDDGMRAAIQEKVAGAIAGDTRVIVGHSLGSVVAYEVLFAHPHPQVRALVTLGSPLGLPNVVFDRLRPAPAAAAGSTKVTGAWPPVRLWANVADTGDVVAAVEDLRPLFGGRIHQLRVHNGAKAHDMTSYLTDPRTGQLILAGLDA
jgi:PGAP1-like protein